MKVLLTRELHDFALEELSKRYKVVVHSGKIPIPKEELQSKIRDVEGLICYPYDKIDREIIDAGQKLRTICTYSVGFDHIDVSYAKKRGILVGYTPEVLTDATADLAFSLILDVSRRVTEGDRLIRDGMWVGSYGAYDYVGMDIQSMTLGILGLGRIGRALAKRAAPFGMDIIYHNRHRATNMEKSLGARYVSLERLLADSDVISIHVPYTDETDGMFDAKLFKKMKNTAFLVNTARGKIVNQIDLVAALKDGTIAGAGLDVFESEPLKKNDPLTRLQNVVLVPHIGSSAIKTREEMARITLENLHRGMAGKEPVYAV